MRETRSMSSDVLQMCRRPDDNKTARVTATLPSRFSVRPFRRAALIMMLQFPVSLAWIATPNAVLKPCARLMSTGMSISAGGRTAVLSGDDKRLHCCGRQQGLSFFSTAHFRGEGGNAFGGQILDLPVATGSSSKSVIGTNVISGGARGARFGGGLRDLVAAVRFPRFGLSRRGRTIRSEKKEASPPVYRSVRQTIKLTRLPVWPVQNGVLMTVLDWLNLESFAAKLEDMWGGRLAFLRSGDPNETDPIVLFAHHRHSFWPLDPIRQLSKLVVPEGFPAHPHRGFQTVTYVMKGGMTHRDSMGMKQTYTEGQVQWLNTGRGIMHEEMWNLDDWVKTDVEIYQIWVNLPSKLKMTRPRIQLAGKGADPDTPPLPVVKPSEGTEVIIIAGEVCGEISPIETMQDLSMLHVKMKPGAEPWECPVPEGHQCFIYVRRGDLTIIPTEEGYFEGEEDRGPQVIPHRRVAWLAFDGDYARFENRGSDPLDFMLIESEPTNENTVARGNFVMNTENELDQAEMDSYRGYFGRSWDYRLTDDEWRESLQGAEGKRTTYKADDRRVRRR